ncbi:hypothetical protein BDN70DRAFT_956980 [Pholiota conissans]|uniref:DUF2421 domain-containing protein n=1 Tax=Pholiota conissans TaxID=109636 RepID=A0A9P6D560_9AGAR|nr:hypothetical protein BDN70DRAFT_956980 [Pholiota conissans]
MPPKGEETPNSGSSSSSSLEEPKNVWLVPILAFADNHFAWVFRNLQWSQVKPVLRCALVAWISTVLFVIPAVETKMGQASFLILIAAFLSPPNDPFMAVLERETLIVLFVTMAWGWSCFGIFLANLARHEHDPNATFTAAVTGQYIEAAPTVIMAIFVFFGSAFFLYIKARQGPGPYIFACVFACICIDICMTTASLFPYPFYLIGRSIAIPITMHSAIALLASIFVFPSTISAVFTTRLSSVLAPMLSTLTMHRALLSDSLSSPSFSATLTAMRSETKKVEAALIPVAAARRLLKSDLIYGRFSPGDFRAFHGLFRRMAGRADGLSVYFGLIDPSRERFPGTANPTPAGTAPATPHRGMSRATSRAPSIERERDHHHHHHHSHHHILHSSLLSLARARAKKPEYAVGTFESQRYLNLELTRLHDPHEEEYTERTVELLKESCDPLLEVCYSGIETAQKWFGTVRDGRLQYLLGIKQAEAKKRQKERLDVIREVRDKVVQKLEEFKEISRYARVLSSIYMPLSQDRRDYVMPPHRYLFNCYVYQYNLIQIASIVVEMLDEILRLEAERTVCKLWTPAERVFLWNPWSIPAGVEHLTDDEDPDVIQGLRVNHADLGLPRRRDPDALPPRNLFESAMALVHRFVVGLGGGNAIFSLKAGALTVILCLPSFIQSSASFAYDNRAVWGIFMGQLTLARFRGETTFVLTARIIMTFFGGITGMVMWYISCGSARGNPFGLAAVCFVCFPFFFFARLYWPIPPMSNIVFFVTSVLVIGFSYQDTHIVVPGAPGYGFSVFWKRFVLVTVGVVAAFIFSFLPPSTTIRRYQRNLLATTMAEMGTIYCNILSFANTKHEAEIQDIVSSLLAVRNKLKKSATLNTNVIYEFSLRGRWPAERYQKIADLQMALAYSLSHLMSVLEHIEPSWSRAFLQRTRFMDPDFQGDILAVISMVSLSLRTGTPLPQITPCPLIDRFMLKYHGLDVIHKDSEEDYGLPRTLSLDTLRNEQYLMFSVGISTAYGIINRLDRLMLAVKEVVGEQYHIHGVGFVAQGAPGFDFGANLGHNVYGELRPQGVELGERTNTVHFDS